MQIGGFRIQTVLSDFISLDGGAMFGSVPKTLWSRRIEPDPQNRIPLCCRLLLLKSEDRTFLVDVGCGTKWSDKERDIFAIVPAGDVPFHEKLDEVTDVIITHLHFDHAGGISYLSGDGDVQLRFPEARVWCSKKNYEHARSPGVRERASYLADNVAILESADLHLLEDGDSIVEGLTVHQAHGHTHGLQWIKVSDGSNVVAYPSDLMPTAHHVSLPYVMGYDLCAETTIREKEAFLTAARDEAWVVIFEHDRDTQAGKIIQDERGRFSLDPVSIAPDL